MGSGVTLGFPAQVSGRRSHLVPGAGGVRPSLRPGGVAPAELEDPAPAVRWVHRAGGQGRVQTSSGLGLWVAPSGSAQRPVLLRPIVVGAVRPEAPSSCDRGANGLRVEGLACGHRAG